ncbi:MAG: F0F1 ATP synthase subunit B' [Pseudomonadota bacterium]
MADAPAAAEAASSGGMPQLDFSNYPNQIFWLLVTLAVIYFILSRVALPRIGGVLAERAGTITNDLAAAEELKLRAEEAEAAYEKALNDARSKAQKIAAKTKADIQAQLDKELAKADAAIAAKAAESEAAIAAIRDTAVTSVKEVASDAAAEIVNTLGGATDAKAVAAAVDARMKG